ncbi:hypothetical protein Tco_0114527, partial [Tanacetum coccineum]
RFQWASDEELEGPMKDQPLSANASPIALSPGYIADSDPEEDKEDPEEDLADHLKDKEDGEEEEHLAENTEAFETDKSASTPPTSPR